jgi:hypothetical protein
MGRARKQLHWEHPKCDHGKGLCFCASRKRYEGKKSAKEAPKRRRQR